MDNITEEQSTEQEQIPVSNAYAAISHLKTGIASGKHWYIALLESIGLWTDETEEYNGQQYSYLISGEAFDWILLAERLCDEVKDIIPEEEKNNLLFRNIPPIEISTEEFKNLIGPIKYHQYLNYFYGVTVEEAMAQAVREEVRKERRSNGQMYRKEKEEDEVSMRIYDTTFNDLWKQFRKLKHSHPSASSNLTEMKEFYYYCFKFRLDICEKAKVASDTQKALKWLRNNSDKSYYTSAF